MPPFPRLSYDEAVELLHGEGKEFEWGDDFGAPDEATISMKYDKPVFVTGYPTKVKAFYMPVSYTHLDVYKRQIWYFLCCSSLNADHRHS